MRRNHVKELLLAGKPAIGSWITIGHPSVAEIMARIGFEWLVVDLEHGAVDIPIAQTLFQAMNGSHPLPMARLPENDPVIIKRTLDIGAYGIVVPMVNSPEEARAAVRAAKYPPQGIRGVGVGRAHAYGMESGTYLKEANDNILVIAQIEHIKAVEKIDEILSVEGLDGIFIGPADLSGSMGLIGQMDHPDVQEACDRVLQAARRAGVAPGIHVFDPDAVRDLIAQGFQFIALEADINFLIKACRMSWEKARPVI